MPAGSHVAGNILPSPAFAATGSATRRPKMPVRASPSAPWATMAMVVGPPETALPRPGYLGPCCGAPMIPLLRLPDLKWSP